MNKTQLIDVVAKNADMKKKEAEAAVNAVLEAITSALADGDKVQLIGFGTFDVKERAAREGYNPFTKEKKDIPASKRASFSASKALKDAINK
jgi:DNA-binding protein HU-beta